MGGGAGRVFRSTLVSSIKIYKLLLYFGGNANLRTLYNLYLIYLSPISYFSILDFSICPIFYIFMLI